MKPDWVPAQFNLREEMSTWVNLVIKKRHMRRKWDGSHDEGTFTSSWDGYYLLSGDKEAYAFRQKLVNDMLEFMNSNYYHGYHKTGEPHHATENYIYFLSPLTLIHEKDKTKNLEILEDAAHHLGNWIEGIPEWFDWENKRFRSWSIGTEKVGSSKDESFEVLDHFRFIKLALDTYRAGGADRYLELAKTYCDRWIAIIEEKNMVPGVLFQDEESERIYYEKNQRIKGINFVSQVRRIDGSGTADSFLTLYRLTGDEKYLNGLRIAFDQLKKIKQNAPLGGIRPRILMKYRMFSGDTSYDEWIRKAVSNYRIPDLDITCRLALLKGMGMMWDYRNADGSIIDWAVPEEDHLTLAYHVTGDEAYITSAFDLGSKKLGASLLLSDGRENPCDGRNISGVSRSATMPLYVGGLGATVGYRTNIDTIQVKYFTAPGELGLPETVAALVEPSPADERRIQLYNDSDAEQTVYISAGNSDGKITRVTAEGCVKNEGELPSFRLPANGLAKIALEIR